jgi:hypothetical protein
MSLAAFDWPARGYALVYLNKFLPENLKMHGAIITLCRQGFGPPILPDAPQKGDPHVILKFNKGSPNGGRTAIVEAAKTIKSGGTVWLAFPTEGEAFAYCRETLSFTTYCHLKRA